MSLLSSPIAAAVFIVISAFFNTSFCSGDDGFFPNCDRTFTCGSLHNITYPFTSGNRPEYCGPLEFRLTCRNNTYAELTSKSVTYRVLEINQTQKSLVLTRPDFSNNSCITNFVNSTLDTAIFTYPRVGNEDINLFYGCTHVNINYIPYNRFSCTLKGINETDSYYLVGPVPDSLVVQNLTKCQVGVVTLVNSNAAERLINNQTTLRETLKEGFNVNYNDIGRKDTNEDTDKVSPDAGSKTKIWLAIKIGTPLLGVGILGVCLLLYWFRRQLFLDKRMMDDQSLEDFIKENRSFAPKRYSYSEIKKMTNSLKNKVGQGGFGSVYKGKLPNGNLVAVKILNVLKGNGEDFINEVASIIRTSHVNVVTLKGYCLQGRKRALVYDFISRGSLEKFIINEATTTEVGSARLDWGTLYRVAVGIARGLEYLHSGCNTMILHLDIKPHNILLDDDFCPKISDFGLAKLCTGKESIVSMVGARGTVGYIAPEVFCRNFGGVSYKSDVYSYGMMVLEMVGARNKAKDEVGNTSSECYFPEWIYKRLEAGGDLGLQGDMTEEENEITKKMTMVGLWCIQTDPSQRPTMGRVLEMLEGSVECLEIPPQPFLNSPSRQLPEYSTTITLQ